jgi:hypothetical protein
MTYRVKTIRAVTKVLDATLGRVHAVVSDETKDRDGDIIRAEFWDTKDFNNHPVLVASHNYFDLRSQIGEWEDMQVVGQGMEGVARYMVGEGNEQADWGFKLAASGRAAYSVGFLPDMDKAKRLADGGYEFRGQSLLEVSHVVVPSNPNALQALKVLRVHGAGVGDVLATLVDEMLESNPGDPDMEALAGKLWPYLEQQVNGLLIPAVSEATKGPIASHSTVTTERSEGSLHGPAWRGAGGEALFPHHDQSVAVLSVCFDAIRDLNTDVEEVAERDKQGVYNHLARHLRDGDKEPPELRGLFGNALQEAIATWN